MNKEIISLAIALLTAFIVGKSFARIGWPTISGQILAGMILSVPVINSVFFNPESINFIHIFSEIGIIFLLFLTGLEVDLKKINASSKDAFLLAFFGALIPFSLGFGAMKLMGYNSSEAIVFGVCLSISAEATTAHVLMRLNKLKSKIGNIILETGLIDDVFGMIFLSGILVLTQSKSVVELAMFPLKLIIFVIIVFIAYKAVPKLLSYIHNGSNPRPTLFTIGIIFCLLFTVLSELIGLGSVLGAIVAGVIMHKSIISKKEEKFEEEGMELISMSFIVPVFFVYIGMNIDLTSIYQYFPIVAITILIAISGKMLGAFAVFPFTNLRLRQLYLIGWATNSRGIVELVIAEIARVNGLLPLELYTSIVVMTVVTTFIFPFFINSQIKKHPDIMD